MNMLQYLQPFCHTGVATAISAFGFAPIYSIWNICDHFQHTFASLQSSHYRFPCVFQLLQTLIWSGFTWAWTQVQKTYASRKPESPLQEKNNSPILPSCPQIPVEGTSKLLKTQPKWSWTVKKWTASHPRKYELGDIKRKCNGRDVLYAWIFPLPSYWSMLYHYKIRKFARNQTVTYSAALPIRNNSSCLHVTQMTAENRNGKRKLRKTNHKHTFHVFKMPCRLRGWKRKRTFSL